MTKGSRTQQNKKAQKAHTYRRTPGSCRFRLGPLQLGQPVNIYGEIAAMACHGQSRKPVWHAFKGVWMSQNPTALRAPFLQGRELQGLERCDAKELLLFKL